jgi:hypothetical protein
MTDSNTTQPSISPAYKVESTEWYIRLEYTRQPTPDDMKAANADIMHLHEEAGLNRLLCDVRQMSSDVPLGTQVEGVKLLWQLRNFEKFAFVSNDPELEKLLASSFSHLKFMHKFRGFHDEADAIAWLRASESSD